MNLLLGYLKNDPRWEVKLKALEHLYELAKPGAHLWPPGAIDDIVDFVLSTKQTKILTPALGKITIFNIRRLFLRNINICLCIVYYFVHYLKIFY